MHKICYPFQPYSTLCLDSERIFSDYIMVECSSFLLVGVPVGYWLPQIPRSHGCFGPIFSDGCNSTNFCSQYELSASSKSWRAVNSSCDVFVFIACHPKKNDESSFTSVIFLRFWGCSIFDPIFVGASAVELVNIIFGTIFDAWYLTVAVGLQLCFMALSVKNKIGSRFRVSVRVHSVIGCTERCGNQ